MTDFTAIAAKTCWLVVGATITSKVAAAKTSQLRLRLEGVAIIPGSKIAVLRDTTSNKMLHLETGNSHQGWELTAITDSVATFKRGEQTQELTLKID